MGWEEMRTLTMQSPYKVGTLMNHLCRTSILGLNPFQKGRTLEKLYRDMAALRKTEQLYSEPGSPQEDRQA